MTVKIRPVQLESERGMLVDVLQRNLPDLSHAGRSEWLYDKNPAGRAWSWFALEEGRSTPIGVASVIPRLMWLGESLKLCGQVADFAIDSAYRSLGPAVLLQKATFGPVNEGLLALCYDCPPDDRGMSTFRRLGMESNCQMHRFARPLRVDRRLSEMLGSANLAYPIAFLGNLFLKILSTRRPAPGIEVSVHEGRFGEEFSNLDRTVRVKDSIRSRRSAEDLNWRFRDDPSIQYEVLAARHRGELLGYVVASTRNDDTYVVDLFGRPLSKVAILLLDAVVERERRKRVQSLHAVAANEGEMTLLLRSARFSCREPSARVVAYSRQDTEAFEFLTARPKWSFTRMDLMA
jgi:hypothetical protein